MIYLTKGGKHLKKTLKALGREDKFVLSSSRVSEKEIIDKLIEHPKAHVVIVMDCTDASAVVQVLSDYMGGFKDELEKVVFDTADKHALVKDLRKKSDAIFKKIDAKIEKMKAMCENTSSIRDKRSKVQEIIDGECSKTDALKVHAKYCKTPKGVIKKLAKGSHFKTIGGMRI